MERLTKKNWRNLDPWECCGQDNYCQRGCHDKGGCTDDCIVLKIYARLALYEDLDLPFEEIKGLQYKNRQLRQWVNDLQSGMFVNCVYCGHRYGPAKDTPVSMADVLKQHIEQCPDHPMSKLKQKIERIKAIVSPLDVKTDHTEKVKQMADAIFEIKDLLDC